MAVVLRAADILFVNVLNIANVTVFNVVYIKSGMYNSYVIVSFAVTAGPQPT